MKTFKDLGLSSELMKSIDDLGFKEPSPVQEKAIPLILESKQDLIALAQTGTGKTAAFSLPILEQIEADGRTLQAIVLCPTRELAVQISQDIKELAKYSKGVTVMPVYGGERIDLQIRTLKRGVNIVVGTPGRVHDLIRRRVLKLGTIQWLVLDEADEMLDMGFKDDLDAILNETPKERQTLLFSATMSKSVASIAKKYMHDAKEISMGDKNVGAENVTHEYYVVNSRDRFEALKRILDYLPGVYGILFCRTRRETQEVADKLRQANYEVEAIHGEVAQNIRTKIMARFKKRQIHLLVATDVAARGIDVKNLTHVINYNLPDQNAAYTHRTGRTGRASQSGIAVSIVGPREIRRIREIEKIIGKTFEHKQVPDGADVYKKQIDNFVELVKHPDINIDGDKNEKYVLEVIERLKSVKKEELIKYFVTKELTPLIHEHKDNRNLNAGFKEVDLKDPKDKRNRVLSNGVNLKINLGRKQRFDIKALFTLINSTKSLHGLDIGQINLMPEYSVFAVDGKWADQAIKEMSGREFKGTKIIVTKGESDIVYPTTTTPRKRDGDSRGGHRKGGYTGGYKGGDRDHKKSGGGRDRKKSSGGYGKKKASGRDGRSDNRNSGSSGKPRGNKSPFGNKKRDR